MADMALTPREGRPALSGSFEGVPEHLRTPISYWLRSEFTQPGGHYFNERFMTKVVAAARLSLSMRDCATPKDLYAWLIEPHFVTDDQLLDVLHVTLQLNQSYRTGDLDQVLELGGSVWRATERGLVRRVDPVAQEAYEQSTKAEDTASAELTEAWSRAHGRNPDPSDAGDHAIKAVETVLIPIVVPNNSKATLSNPIGELRSQSDRWQLAVRGRTRDHSVAPLVEMLSVIWPDPNRHGSATPEAPATVEGGHALSSTSL